jgi:DNA-binding MarR family transcriptional regulator
MATAHPPSLLTLTTYLLSQTAKVAKRQLDVQLQERGLRLRHMLVLAWLTDNGSTSQLSLATNLGLDPSDVTSTIDDLEDMELVKRAVDPADRRRKLITVTRRGATEFAHLQGLAAEISDDLLGPLSPSRRAALHADLRKVLGT